VQKTILIALEDDRTSDLCLRAAYEVGCKLGSSARFDALVLRPDPLSLILPSEQFLTHAMQAEMDAHDRREAAAIHARFEAWRDRLGISNCSFTCEDAMGSMPTDLAHRGRMADLVVAAAPRAIGKVDRPALTAALFGTHRPVLLVPSRLPVAIGARIAVAWRDDSRAPQAVLAAMPLLAGAARVFVLVGRTGEMASPPPLPAIFGAHDIDAEIFQVGSDDLPIRAALLQQATALRADLLVMGAYAHSPVREMILGGVTRHVLAEAEIPVLLRH
jgi:nucleotide-binding universal stress UspA family protein